MVIAVLVSALFGWKSYEFLVLYDAQKDDFRETKKRPISYKIYQMWNQGVSFFVGCAIVFYFLKVRWPQIEQGSDVGLSDFGLIIFLLMSVTGLMPYFLTNITKGVEAILNKVLSR